MSVFDRLSPAQALRVARAIEWAVEEHDRRRQRTGLGPADPVLLEVVAGLRGQSAASAPEGRVRGRGERCRLVEGTPGEAAEVATVGAVEAASLMGVSRERVGQLARRGDLPGAVKHGRDWRIPRSTIDERRAHARDGS